MAKNVSSIHMKVFMDKRKEKVIFAQADEDFVDFLISFFTLPLGTIARLSRKHAGSNDIKLGSLPSLYESVLNLDVMTFTNVHCKTHLVNPQISLADLCQKLRLNLNDTDPHVTGSNGEAVFVKKMGSFIITDNLDITPFSLDRYMELCDNLGVEHFELQQNFCRENLCAQVDNFFVELLFSFLTIPLGAVKRLTMDSSSLAGIDKLYRGISKLGAGDHFIYEDIKTKLLSPKLASNYLNVTGFLLIYEKERQLGSFLKGEATFKVSDDLKIELSPSFTTIRNLTSGIPVTDIEILEVSIGEPEALLILKTSLTSTSVLTDCLPAFNQIPKEKST